MLGEDYFRFIASNSFEPKNNFIYLLICLLHGENMKQTIIALLLIAAALIAGCTEQNNANMANPASVYCVEHGGTVEIITEAAGQVGLCKLADGSTCEEWAYFRGQCPVNYEITETLNESCNDDMDCDTPMEYLLMSRCPFTSKCLDGQCTVVCPLYNGTGYPQVRECGTCPMLSQPAPGWCNGGNITPGIKDECGCQRAPVCQHAPEEPIGMANPASQYCIKQGGVLEIIDEADGQVGYCILPGGKRCEEWAYFRGECEEVHHVCTESQKNAQICTLEYMPVCGWFNESIKCIKYPCGATYGNKCQACADAKVASWTNGECPA
jgi:uncharacterized protein